MCRIGEKVQLIVMEYYYYYYYYMYMYIILCHTGFSVIEKHLAQFTADVWKCLPRSERW